MSIAPSALRAAIEAHLVANLGALSPPWIVSRTSYHTFPGADPKQLEALCFAVGLPDSEMAGRKGGPAPIPTVTAFGVKFTSQVRADSQVEDVSLGYERAELLLETLRALTGGVVTPQRLTREVIGDGTVFYGHLTGIIVHAHP